EFAAAAAQHYGFVIAHGHALHIEQNLLGVLRGEIEAHVIFRDDTWRDREAELAVVHRLRIREAFALAQAHGAGLAEFYFFGAEPACDRIHLLFRSRSGLIEFVDLGELLRPRVVELVDGDGHANAVIIFFQELSVNAA